MTVEERFWSKVYISDGCWQWFGNFNVEGYGYFGVNGKTKSAHRYSYETQIGPIPKGLHIHHTCHVRHCVNPDHLEAVTQAENNRKRTMPKKFGFHKYCILGHEIAGDNLLIWFDSLRLCKRCYEA